MKKNLSFVKLPNIFGIKDENWNIPNNRVIVTREYSKSISDIKQSIDSYIPGAFDILNFIYDQPSIEEYTKYDSCKIVSYSIGDLYAKMKMNILSHGNLTEVNNPNKLDKNSREMILAGFPFCKSMIEFKQIVKSTEKNDNTWKNAKHNGKTIPWMRLWDNVDNNLNDHYGLKIEFVDWLVSSGVVLIRFNKDIKKKYDSIFESIKKDVNYWFANVEPSLLSNWEYDQSLMLFSKPMGRSSFTLSNVPDNLTEEDIREWFMNNGLGKVTFYEKIHLKGKAAAKIELADELNTELIKYLSPLKIKESLITVNFPQQLKLDKNPRKSISFKNYKGKIDKGKTTNNNLSENKVGTKKINNEQGKKRKHYVKQQDKQHGKKYGKHIIQPFDNDSIKRKRKHENTYPFKQRPRNKREK